MVCEKILVWVLRLIAITQEKFEKVKQAQKIKPPDCALSPKSSATSRFAVGGHTYIDQSQCSLASDPEIVIRHEDSLR